MPESLLSGDNSTPAGDAISNPATSAAPTPITSLPSHGEGVPSLATPPSPAPAVDVKIPDNWKQALAKELQEDPSLSSIMDINALAKSYVHAQKMVGKDKIVIPDKFATDDDWKGVMQKLGLPETKDKYEFKAPGTVDKDFLDNFKEFAHKSAILPRQAEKLFEWYDGYVSKINEQAETARKTDFDNTVAGLKKEWGAAYDRKLSAAKEVFLKTTDEDTQKFFTESGLANNPKVVKLFAKLAEQLGEDKFVDGASTGKMGMTPGEASERINQIYGNKDHPYWNAKHPSHKDAINEMQKLFSMQTNS